MRTTLSAALLVSLALFGAGCLGEPVPMIESHTAYAGSTCTVGSFVTGFDDNGTPLCTPPSFAGGDCDEGEVMTGITTDGAPSCAPIMDVAQAAMEQEQAAEPEPSRPSKTLSLTSNGPIQDGYKTYTIASASPGMSWGELHFTLDGASLAPAAHCEPTTGQYAACAAGALEAESAAVDAGDRLIVSASSGQTLRILDADANAVILTLTVG